VASSKPHKGVVARAEHSAAKQNVASSKPRKGIVARAEHSATKRTRTAARS
jgi:hypothetical protein